MKIYVGQKLTLNQLDNAINGNMESYDIERDILNQEPNIGSYDCIGVNYIFTHEAISDNPIDTMVTITDIDKL